MKTPLLVIILIVVGILGILIVYTQTGLPQKEATHEAVAAAYGGGSVTKGVEYEAIAVIIILFVAVLLSGPIIRKTLTRKSKVL